jgi:hypothetical protein
MKKLVIVLGLMLLISSEGYGRSIETRNIVNSSDGVNISVASTGVTYTKSFLIADGEYFEVSYYGVSTSGSVDVTIELEQSFQAPTTEGVADSTYKEPVNFADIVTNLTTESTWYHKGFSPTSLMYGRFKITGNGSNNADTVLNMVLSKQITR